MKASDKKHHLKRYEKLCSELALYKEKQEVSWAALWYYTEVYAQRHLLDNTELGTNYYNQKNHIEFKYGVRDALQYYNHQTLHDKYSLEKNP